MKSYGQFCPVAKAAELFCERWTPLVLRDLAAGSTRFSQLQRGVPLMSPTLLSHRLKQLEAEGVIERRKPETGRGWTYHLTEAGQEFAPLVESLGIWGQRWTRRELAENEVDLGLLLWAMERSVKADAFGKSPAVVHVTFTDQPPNKQIWWFLNQGDTCELCVEDPGFEVDLYLSTTLPDMIYIVRGDLTVSKALDTERLDAVGPSALRRKIAAWINLRPLYKVQPARQELAAV